MQDGCVKQRAWQDANGDVRYSNAMRRGKMRRMLTHNGVQSCKIRLSRVIRQVLVVLSCMDGFAACKCYSSYLASL